MRKDNRTSQNGIQFETENVMQNSSLLKRFVDLLPFELTNAQKRVFSEIREDMQSKRVIEPTYSR